MKKDQFFRMKASLMADDCIIHLIEQEGISGFGIYIALLLELRLRDNYRISRLSLPALARRWNITIEELERVVDGYKLFVHEQEADEQLFRSPYLDEVMVELEEKRLLQSAAGKRRAATAQRASEGSFTSFHQPVEKSTVEKSTAVAIAAEDVGLFKETSLRPFKGWEAYVDEAFGEQSWMEVQAMHSKLGRRLMEHPDIVSALFKQHIRTYGKESSIGSLADAKSYFSNFVRPGTPTRERVEQLLNRHDSVALEQDVYRYEQRDPQTGERSYCGMLIPKTAPPRPNANSIWNECLWQWE